MTEINYTAINQKSLDNFISDNQSISHVSKRSLVYGIGINDSDYITKPMINGKQVTCAFYKTWQLMLQRCYSEKFHKKYPTYKDCTTAPEWHSFMAFKSWMIERDYEGKEIDKDLLVIGNKIYSPEACIFVSKQVNYLMGSCAAKRGLLPQGVSFDRGRYLARVRIKGTETRVGRYSTIPEAEASYVKAKSANIIRTALEQTDMRLMKSLINHADYMRINFECKQLASP